MKNLFYLSIVLSCLCFFSCSQNAEPTEKSIDLTGELKVRGDRSTVMSNEPLNPDSNLIKPEPGMLTAGQWDDLEAWDFWQQLTENTNFKDYKNHWGMHPQQRYDVDITDALGQPASDIVIQLKDPIAGTLWESRTNHAGRATLWVQPFTPSTGVVDGLELVVVDGKKKTKIGAAVPYIEGVASWQLSPKVNAEVNKLDVLFVVDATGSMEDEINYLKAELQDVMKGYQVIKPEVNVRLGSIFYRDYAPKADYLTRTASLSEDYQATFDFINQQKTSGGGDFAEAVEAALAQAIDQDWTDQKATRLMFLFLDAPAHHNAKSLAQMQATLKAAAAKGVRIIPIASSGTDKETEFLMRFCSILTGGTYVFLTDHSGIGKGHIEPTVGDYQVEYLNDVMLKLLEKYTTKVMQPVQ
jgi:hypothetical protein